MRKRKIISIIKKEPKSISSKVARLVKSESSGEIHPITVRRTLKTAGYESQELQDENMHCEIKKKRIGIHY